MTIAITGGTGFLGLRLLSLLLHRGKPVVVLAHAGTAPATKRIMRHLTARGQPDESLHAAKTLMTVLNADVHRPRLGLPEWQFRALAEQLTEIWHSAAATTLDGPQIPALRTQLRQPLDTHSELVRRTNVEGTNHVLELAAAGEAMVNHVSTVFVAGRRRTGTVGEDDLDASYGFENPYEESKFLAELAVREWSARFGRPVTVFRPSLLVTEEPSHPGDAPQTLAVLATLADYVRAMFGPPASVGTDRPTVRIACHPEAHLNLMPGDLATRLMVQIAAKPAHTGVRTVHISYPHEVKYKTLFALFEDLYPIQVATVAVAPTMPTRLESLISQHMRMVTAYAFHRRYYDRTTLQAAGLDPTDAPPLGLDYLLAGLRQPAAIQW